MKGIWLTILLSKLLVFSLHFLGKQTQQHLLTLEIFQLRCKSQSQCIHSIAHLHPDFSVKWIKAFRMIESKCMSHEDLEECQSQTISILHESISWLPCKPCMTHACAVSRVEIVKMSTGAVILGWPYQVAFGITLSSCFWLSFTKY